VKHARLAVSLAFAVLGAKLLAWATKVMPVEPLTKSRAMETVKGGFFSVLPRERSAFELGEKWRRAFSPRACDLDSVEAHNRALEFSFRSSRFEAES
jgi:hypothetical protein